MEKGFDALRGFREMLPEEIELERNVAEKARSIFDLYGYQEVGIPIVEPIDLFELKSGEEIKHRMFRFTNMGDRQVSLRPEGTPAVARMAAAKLRERPLPLRVSYAGSMFRYDEPQKGRYREFSQVGLELLGSAEPYADAEVVSAVNMLMKELGFNDYRIRIGHEGIIRGLLQKAGLGEEAQNAMLSRIDRRKLEEAFQVYDSAKGDGERRAILKDLLEPPSGGKDARIARARNLLAGIDECSKSLDSFGEILRILDESGVRSLDVDISFARGLDYYTGMIFEVYSPQLEVALGGGGRYDRLLGLFGWDIPAVGCALGVDRIALAIKESGLTTGSHKSERLMLSAIDRPFMDYAFQVANRLREHGVSVIFETTRRAPNTALGKARRLGVRYLGIIGPRERESNTVSIRDLSDGIEFILDAEGTADLIRKRGNPRT